MISIIKYLFEAELVDKPIPEYYKRLESIHDEPDKEKQEQMREEDTQKVRQDMYDTKRKILKRWFGPNHEPNHEPDEKHESGMSAEEHELIKRHNDPISGTYEQLTISEKLKKLKALREKHEPETTSEHIKKAIKSVPKPTAPTEKHDPGTFMHPIKKMIDLAR